MITLLLVIFNRRAEIGVIFHGSIDESDAFIFEFLAIANLASVGTATLSIVSWRRRGGAENRYQARALTVGCKDTYRSRSGGTKSFSLSLRFISSNRR